MSILHLPYDISGDIDQVIEQLADQLGVIKGKNLLITGGTGFFGRWLLQILCQINVKLGYEVGIYVLSRNPKGFLTSHPDYPFNNWVKFIDGDVKNFVLPHMKVDYLIHMATTAAFETYEGEDQLNKLDLLYSGTKNTLIQSAHSGVERVLFTSSGVAYGPSNGKILSEEDLSGPSTINTNSALGEGKRVAEYLVSYYADKFKYDFAIARCFSFFGPYLPLDIHYAIGNFVNDALSKKEITIHGTGQDLRSYLYMADAWTWLLRMLFNANNQIFNVGSSNSISIKDLAVLVGQTLSPAKPINMLGKVGSIGNFARNIYIPDTNKIQNQLGVREITSLRSGILKMANR